jgi:hypothetical protein
LAVHASNERVAAAWVLVQFLAVFGQGCVAPIRRFCTASWPDCRHWCWVYAASSLPAQFVVIAWLLAPSGALLAAALMRFMRRRS